MATGYYYPVFILGFGSAFAQHTITAQSLESAGISVAKDAPSTRSTIISGDLRASPEDRLLKSEENATSLGRKAVTAACEASGITIADLKVVIGDCGTPVQTTPSEGQRVAGTLGLKIPAYDIGGAAIANILHIDSVRKWKKDRVTEYGCFFSSNVPTHAADFNFPLAQFFADGASAAIVSAQHPGKFKIIDSQLFYSTDHLDEFRIEKLEGFRITDTFRSIISKRCDYVLSAIAERYAKEIQSAYLINNQLTCEHSRQAAKKIGFQNEKIFDFGNSNGDMLGATPFAIAATHQNDFSVGSYVFLIAAGIGSGFGYAVLKVEA